MKTIDTKLVAITLLPVMILSLSGCGSNSKVGKTYKFSCPYGDAYIYLYDGWSADSGRGECKNVYEKKYTGGAWCASGSFTYDKSKLTFTSGSFKGKSYTRSELGLKYDSKNHALYVFGKLYC